MRIATAALRFFYNAVLGHHWQLFGLVRTPDKQTLPTVLSREEVRRLMAVLKEERFRVIVQLLCSCGLRMLHHPHVHILIPAVALSAHGCALLHPQNKRS